MSGEGQLPPGHSTAAHLLIGWCAKCPGRSELREVHAWRWWAVNHVPEVADLVGPVPRPARPPATGPDDPVA
jgi:hypothetical protein